MKSIHRTYRIRASAEHIFTALTNPLTIEMWTDSPAVMEPVAGTEFSLYDGEITGINLEIRQDQLIRQQWYFEGEEVQSIVTITLSPQGKDTRVELEHTNIPDAVFENIQDGWDRYYFKPLRMVLED